MDNLYKISVRIRSPTLHSRSLKAASYRPKDPETGVDLLEQYAAFDLQYTRELFRNLCAANTSTVNIENDVLVGRLSRSITLRRRQFKYWKRHRDKLGALPTGVEQEVKLTQQDRRPEGFSQEMTTAVQPEFHVILPMREEPSEKAPKSMLSGTEVTHHHESLDNLVDNKSVTSYATTTLDLTGRGIELPPPPKAAGDGEKDFECPYCFVICPARYGTGRSWRTHLLQDLQPYVCTYDECHNPDQLFRSHVWDAQRLPNTESSSPTQGTQGSDTSGP